MLPKENGSANSELEEAMSPIRRRVLYGYVAIGTWFAILALAGILAGPAYLDMFAAFGVEPSDLAEHLIGSVNYWGIAPLITFSCPTNLSLLWVHSDWWHCIVFNIADHLHTVNGKAK